MSEEFAGGMGAAQVGVEVRRGLPPELREAAARLYLDAFENKIGAILKPEEKALAILGASFREDKAIVAIHPESGRLAGLIGFKDEEGPFLDLRFHQVRRYYQYLSACWRMAVLALLLQNRRPGALLIDGLAVDRDMRGAGIGSLLLQAVEDHARQSGHRQLQLDVVDTNPRARELYERRGFVPVETSRFPILRPVFGCSASTTMIKAL